MKEFMGKKKVLYPVMFIFILCNFLILIFCGDTLAGGLYLNEFATPSMGTAGAGSGAWANDASTALHNPAGMTRIDGKELMLGAGFVYVDAKFDPAPDTPHDGGNGGSAGGTVPFGGIFYAQSISDDLSFGINLSSPSAAALDYENTWTGRYQCQEVSILTMALNPTLAYRLNDQFSVAAGMSFLYGALELDVAVPRLLPVREDGKASIDGDDTTVSFNLAALYELSDATRFGLVYWYESDFDFSGDVKLSPSDLTAGINTELILPQVLEASFYHELNDQIAFLGTVGWEDWSKLGYINISTTNVSAALPKQWDDTWHFAGGIHYHLSDLWMLQCGLAYDTSPTTREWRTAEMPIDRQIRYAVGATYEYSNTLTIGTALEYADYGSANIDSDSLKGKYGSNDLFFGAVNFNWKF